VCGMSPNVAPLSLAPSFFSGPTYSGAPPSAVVSPHGFLFSPASLYGESPPTRTSGASLFFRLGAPIQHHLSQCAHLWQVRWTTATEG